MKFIFAIALSVSAAWSLSEGELNFSLAGKTYSTTHAQALVQVKGKKTRIFVAVKDVTAHFLLVFTADVEAGQETQPLSLNTADSALTVSLRTRQGTFAVMPQMQLAKVDPQITYVERTEVDTGKLEEDPNHKPTLHHARKMRPKIKAEYRRTKPKWHSMSKHDRIKTGEGVVENNAFKDTHFALQLTPVVAQGKVVSYTGTFSGSGRFAKSITGGEVKAISNGAFNVKVENVP